MTAHATTERKDFLDRLCHRQGLTGSEPAVLQLVAPGRSCEKAAASVQVRSQLSPNYSPFNRQIAVSPRELLPLPAAVDS